MLISVEEFSDSEQEFDIPPATTSETKGSTTPVKKTEDSEIIHLDSTEEQKNTDIGNAKHESRSKRRSERGRRAEAESIGSLIDVDLSGND